MNAQVLTWPLAFLLTLAVELPIYRALAQARVPDAALANLWTHPCVWFLAAPLAEALTPPFAFVVLELAAFAFEGFYLTKRGVRRAWCAAFAANSASVVLGLVLSGTDVWHEAQTCIERAVAR